MTALTMTLPIESTSSAGSLAWIGDGRPIVVGVMLAMGTTSTVAIPGEPISSSMYILDRSTTSGTTIVTPSTAGSQIGELRRLTGLTWEQLASLFGLSRRSLHFWASGKPMASSNEEHLHRLLATVRKLDRGSAAQNRGVLLTAASTGEVPFDLLAGKHYEHALAVVGTESARPRVSPPTLSRAAREARKPRPPAERVDVLEDRVHREQGPARAARSVKVRGAVRS